MFIKRLQGKFRIRHVLSTTGLLASLWTPLSAQTVPNPPIPERIPRPTPAPSVAPSPLPPQRNPLPIPPATAPPSNLLPDGAPQTINVRRYEVVGSTVFSRAQLEKVTRPFAGKVSFDDILKASAAVQDLYLKRQYLTTGAYVPARQALRIDGAIVRIQVMEGSLEDIKISGTRRLQPGYIRSRLAIAATPPLNLERLVTALRLLQLNPLIETVAAELSTGTQPGTSLLEVRVKERKAFSAQVLTDNNRSPSIGSWQRQLQLAQANLLGLGDGLTFAYANTQGSNTFDVNYALPLGSRDTTLSFGFGTTLSRVIEEPFDQANIRSRSRYYEFTLRQPLLQTATQDKSRELALGLTAARLESETSLSGDPFALSPGADAKGRTRISALRFFQEYIQRSNREVLTLRSQFSLGLNALNSTLNEQAPDSRFFAWRGQGRWFRLLAPETALLLRADVQLADQALVPFEQFGLGGQASIRGYRQDALLADNGIFTSAELQLPIFRLRKQQAVLQVIPFLDFGSVWNRSNAEDLQTNTLVSTGLGLQWQQENLLIRLDWGIPLVDLTSRRNTWQENGLYFSVRHSPF